jgi:hypothetical protein
LKAKLGISIVMTNVGRVYGNRCSELGRVLVDAFAHNWSGIIQGDTRDDAHPFVLTSVRTVHLRDSYYQNAKYENRPIQCIKKKNPQNGSQF